jgi:hypothetical protein
MLTQEEKNQALLYAHNGATFMFIPNEHLCSLIVADSPFTRGINKHLKIILLERKPIRMDTETIKSYCFGELDSNNSWVLDHGDIKVVPQRFETKKKENNNG